MCMISWTRSARKQKRARAGDRAGALRCLERAEAAAGGRAHPYTYRIALERATLLLQPGKVIDAATRSAQASQARDLALEIAERSRAHDVLIHHRMALLLAAEATF